MIFWAIFGFITPTYEHSIVNMTVHSVALFMKQLHDVITITGALHNLLYSTIGNILGVSVFFWPCYAFTGQEEKNYSKELA